jgi:hypothetical protein
MVCNQIWLNLLVDDHYLLHKSGEQITLILIQHIPTTKVQHVLAELIFFFFKLNNLMKSMKYLNI